MTRQTSIRAYQEFEASGMADTRRGQAYRELYRRGPLTGNELARNCKVPGMWKRLSELKTMKLVVEVGTRACGVTGETAYEWDVTAHIPSSWNYVRPAPRTFYLVQNGKSLELFTDKDEAQAIHVVRRGSEFVELREVL